MTASRLEVLEVLRRTGQYFAKAGIGTPRLDAEVLLGHVLGLARIQLYAGFDRPLTPAELDEFRSLVRRRADRIPVAYLVGTKEFHSLDFEVTPDVLIPRPETEHLVDLAVEFARGLPAPRLLDLGTGSGAIAVAWARELSGGSFLATDRSSAALAVARRNAERHGVADRAEFREADLFEGLGGAGEFDLVACNPPYVAPGEEVDPECAHEPRDALYPPRGEVAEFYARIAAGAPAHLKPGAHLLLELPGDRVEEIRAAVEEHLPVVRVQLDYDRHPRVMVARHPS